jgi:hypothetical protein
MKEQAIKAEKIKKEGLSPVVVQKNERGIFGQFLAAKKVVYDEDKQAIHPELIDDK